MIFGEKYLKRKAKAKATVVQKQISAGIVQDALAQYFSPLGTLGPDVVDVEIEGLPSKVNIKIYYKKE